MELPCPAIRAARFLKPIHSASPEWIQSQRFARTANWTSKAIIPCKSAWRRESPESGSRDPAASPLMAKGFMSTDRLRSFVIGSILVRSGCTALSSGAQYSRTGSALSVSLFPKNALLPAARSMSTGYISNAHRPVSLKTHKQKSLSEGLIR